MDTARVRINTLINIIPEVNIRSVYPNPANDRFFVSGATEKIQHIAIFNLLGQKVMQIENPHQNEGIDIRRLCNGMYFVSLQSDGETISTIRLIKK